MLEALEQIRTAEQKNKQFEQELTRQLANDEEQKKVALEKLEKELKVKLLEEVSSREKQLETELQKEGEQLEQEAITVRENLALRYQEKREQAVETIIERVKQTYGCS
ncbi:MAG: hypothetical protein ACK5NA_10115 [Enterococcus sp.]